MSTIAPDVVNAINTVIDSNHLLEPPGWVRQKSKAAELAADLQDNQFLMEIMERVRGFRETGTRVKTEDNAKRAAAEMFWDTIVGRMTRAQYGRLFLESGSSLVYVSQALQQRIRAGRPNRWTVATNNALVLMQLMLFHDGEVRRNPPEAPDPNDPYGAIFTDACRRAYEEPPSRPRSLYPSEVAAKKEIMALLQGEGQKDGQIILATASGWDTQHKESDFQGPHVGSHANMLFKRAIFEVGQPVVLFFTRHKIDPRFPEARFKRRNDREPPQPGVRYCYPVFGPGLKLSKALVNTPLAIVVGYERESRDPKDIRSIGERIKEVLAVHLKGRNFDLDYAAKEFVTTEASSGAIMVANRRFSDLFPKD